LHDFIFFSGHFVYYQGQILIVYVLDSRHDTDARFFCFCITVRPKFNIVGLSNSTYWHSQFQTL